MVLATDKGHEDKRVVQLALWICQGMSGREKVEDRKKDMEEQEKSTTRGLEEV
jgi:hypothetical protein